MLLQGKFTLQMKVRLDTLPFDVLKEMTTYLDVGHIISLSQVNQALRALLINDNTSHRHYLESTHSNESSLSYTLIPITTTTPSFKRKSKLSVSIVPLGKRY
jgi:hypothetical protein